MLDLCWGWLSCNKSKKMKYHSHREPRGYGEKQTC